MYDTIIWATDGSEAADAAMDEASGLAELMDARLLAVHVDEKTPGGRAGGLPLHIDEPAVRRKIDEQVDALRLDGIDADLIVLPSSRQPARLVAELARDIGAELVVCGTRGLGALSGAFLGSFTQRLLHIAPCPVLAVGPRSRLNGAVGEASAGVTA